MAHNIMHIVILDYNDLYINVNITLMLQPMIIDHILFVDCILYC